MSPRARAGSEAVAGVGKPGRAEGIIMALDQGCGRVKY